MQVFALQHPWMVFILGLVLIISIGEAIEAFANRKKAE